MAHTIMVDPRAGGQGVGWAMMAELERKARVQGVASLWAGVSSENSGGVEFHARIGTEEVACLPQVGFKFGRWMDLVLMRKWLG